MIPKSTQIEFGNLSRGANNPILLKKKTDENGDTVLRIYQRKDIQSISSPIEKIKNLLKYSLEDFGREHKTVAKLLEKIGFGEIREFETKAIKDQTDFASLIEKVRLGTRTGLVDAESEKYLVDLLYDNNIDDRTPLKFNEDAYSGEDLARDLKYLAQKNKFPSVDILDEFNLLKGFIDSTAFDEPLKHHLRFNTQFGRAKLIRDEVKKIFENHHIESQLIDKFFKKLDQILIDPILIKIGAEDAKNWLIQYENKLSKALVNADNQESTKSENSVIHNINSAFSNQEQDSDEKKIKSMVNLYYRYKDSKDVPKIITAYIYFSVEKLLKKNPDLKEIVKELQEAHDDIERAANRIESKQEIQGADDDQA